MPEVMSAQDEWIFLCVSEKLEDSGLAASFEVVYDGECLRAFAVRYQQKVQAYLNRCSHVAMELDWKPDHFFDASGQWLICAAHGAMYAPDTGEGVAGPCRGGLVKIRLLENEQGIFWQANERLRPVNFD